MNIKNEILKALKNKTLSAGHGLRHSIRVLKNGLQISKNLKIDKDTLTAALLLHDCERDNEKNHALKSAEKAIKILESLGFSKTKIELVFNAIKNHSRTDLTNSEKAAYAKVLYDADKIDGVGEQAIQRVLEIQNSKGWNENQAAEWYLRRILDVAKNEPLYFDKSKKLAKTRLEQSLKWCEKALGKQFKKILNLHGFKNIKQIKF